MKDVLRGGIRQEHKPTFLTITINHVVTKAALSASTGRMREERPAQAAASERERASAQPRPFPGRRPPHVTQFNPGQSSRELNAVQGENIITYI